MKHYWKREVNLFVLVISIVLLSVFEKYLEEKTQNNKVENCAEKSKEVFMGWRKSFFWVEVL